MVTDCPKREELAQAAKDILEEIVSIVNKTRIALKQGDQQTLMILDNQLEHSIGAKERAFGALREHTKEHGC